MAPVAPPQAPTLARPECEVPRADRPAEAMRVLRAAAWAAAVSGAPSTLHALANGRDPLEATLAAGSVLLPRARSRRLLALGALPVHLALSAGWTLALDRAGVRGARAGAAAGLAIAALDLGVVGRRFPRVRALPRAPQVADHVLFGIVAARQLKRTRGGSRRPSRRPV